MSRLVLIDGSNLYESARALSMKVDYKRLLDLLNEDGALLRAYYFTALPDRSIENWIHKQVDWMMNNGYSVISKPMKEYVDASGRKKQKGNIDMEIAVCAMTQAQLATEIWIFSGDGDFAVLIKALQERFAVKVYVVSSSTLVSHELRRQADKYIPLEDIRQDIEKLL